MKSVKAAVKDTDEPLHYELGRGQSLELAPSALVVLAEYRQKHFWAREAGGQLFAEIEDKQVRVVRAGRPKALDLRSRFGFAPHRPSEQREINANFGDGLHYVGDWHTHPEDSPTPSLTDASSINECVLQSKHQLTGFLLLIVGRLPFPDGLYLGVADGRRLTELHPPQPRVLEARETR